ncbi:MULTISPECIES: sensor histidine kinase [unclassified Streptomyces]|uniref:sensor histidine kinase n=1 Tax=unclassified Streptomyces TaxID=2593676 RepID=UPI0021AFA7D1|nr:ATP-binding protein [Streptomyces sp. WAC00469]
MHEQSQSAVLLELLRHLSRREHALVSRALESLGELQARTDEPELLAGIYDADHLVTRMRRMVESKAVLSGESLRSARRPVSVMTVLRGAVSEVVQYPRVRVAAGAVGAELALPGYVGPELSHLVAELIENATEFSDPRTRVLVRAEKVPAGLAVEVEDRAVPMSPQQRMRLNRLLAAPDEVDVSAQLRDGQIGLLTAAKIARRHGMKVTLHENPAGGTTAVVVVPARLLVRLETPDVISVPDTAAVASAAGDRPLPAAEPPPPVARSSTARPEQRANDAGQAPAPPAPPADRPRLPRRQQQRLPLPDTGPQIQSAPRGTATPGLAAAFRSGQQAARGLGAAVPGDPVTAADHGCAPTEHP